VNAFGWRKEACLDRHPKPAMSERIKTGQRR
jgi:hypothetical protein